MSISDKDYFKDVEATITDADRVKAGYKIPKRQATVGLPPPIDVRALRGNLSKIAIPVPLNFHEGGLFNDPEERRRFNRPKPEPEPETPSSSDSTPLLPDNGLNELPPTQPEPTPAEETRVVPGSSLQTMEAGQLTQLLNGTQVDHRLAEQTSTNPFYSKSLLDAPGDMNIVDVADDKLIIARGANNIYGHAGFYGAIFKDDKFGVFPGAEHPILRYNPDPDSIPGLTIQEPQPRPRLEHLPQQRQLQRLLAFSPRRSSPASPACASPACASPLPPPRCREPQQLHLEHLTQQLAELQQSIQHIGQVVTSIQGRLANIESKSTSARSTAPTQASSNMGAGHVLASNHRAHVMLRIETLGNRPGCPILAIAAVPFDPAATEISRVDGDDCFYSAIDLSQNPGPYFDGIDPQKITQWLQMSQGARDSVTTNTRPLRDVLKHLTSYLLMLCHDNVQELVIYEDSVEEYSTIQLLTDAYESLGLSKSMTWKNCILHNIESYKALVPLSDDKVPQFEGHRHYAFDEAVYSIICLLLALQRIHIQSANPNNTAVC